MEEEKKKFIEMLEKNLEETIKGIDEDVEKLPKSLKNSEFVIANVSGRKEAYNDVISYLKKELKKEVV